MDTITLVLTDAQSNHNKFWRATVQPSGVVLVEWGRVGTAGQSTTKPGGAWALEQMANKKKAKGYQEVMLAGNTTAPNNQLLEKVAVAQIAGEDTQLRDLIIRLVRENQHQIEGMSGGAIKFNAQGIAQTALGPVTHYAIAQARQLLNQIETLVRQQDFGNSFQKVVSDYLQYVPQKVKSRDWAKAFVGSANLVLQQANFLDSLESAVSSAVTAVDETEGALPSVFTCSLTDCTATMLSQITKLYMKTRSDRHSCSNLRPVRVWEVVIPEMAERFEKEGRVLGNVQQLWHGTRTYNLLSILRKGLIVPKSGGTYNITGRMFGDGLYFSDQSSKSLNYAYGYWSGGRDPNCFMFLADVAMGKAYEPNRVISKIPAGYNSIFAKAHQAGVINNEMIVPSVSQANLRYLVEFA